MLLHLSRYSNPSTPIMSTGNISFLFFCPWLFERGGGDRINVGKNQIGPVGFGIYIYIYIYIYSALKYLPLNNDNFV
jgi:hypothetical protein